MDHRSVEIELVTFELSRLPGGDPLERRVQGRCESVAKAGFLPSKARHRGEGRKAIFRGIRTTEPGLSSNRLRSWLALRSRSNPNRWNWLADTPGFYCFGYLHHCFSQGMPSLFPSILTPGQFCKKKVASWQDVIWEQYVRPSHLNCCEGIVSAMGLRGRAGSVETWVLAKATCWP